MIRAFGRLERVQCVRMIVLPLQPAYQPFYCLLFAVAGRLDAERIAGVVADGTGDPPALAFFGRKPVSALPELDLPHTPNLPGPTDAIKGSIRFSRSASATTRAGRGPRRMPFRKRPGT